MDICCERERVMEQRRKGGGGQSSKEIKFSWDTLVYSGYIPASVLEVAYW